LIPGLVYSPQLENFLFKGIKYAIEHYVEVF